MLVRGYKRGIVFGIIILFIGTGVAPGISGNISDLNVDEKITDTSLPVTDSTSLTFYTFGKTGENKCNVVLPQDVANLIFDMFEELKYKIVYEPRSDEIQDLKKEFVDLLDAYGLIPDGLSKNYVLSLLNPSWLKTKHKTTTVRTKIIPKNSLMSHNTEIIVNPQQIYKNHLGRSILEKFHKNTIKKSPFRDSASAFFCSMTSAGFGVSLPLFMLPRPRIVALWSGQGSATLVGALLGGKSFMAEGAQAGISLGFLGVGLTFAVPGYIFYAFIGYALFTMISADAIWYYEEPNHEPVISDENPPSGTSNVPVSLSKLSFRISDPDGDRMDYTVTTMPDIGSGSGNLKPGGVYSVSVSGLEELTEYTWHIEVTDGKDTTSKDFSFTTEAIAPIISNPLPQDNEKYIPLSLSQLSFHLKDYQQDPIDYTVETSPDIGSGSGIGVGGGTYFVPVSGLDYSVEYVWYVNATDGEHQSNKVFRFQTEHDMIFDPFDEGWQYRKKITIDHRKVDGNLKNFPVLISTSDVDLRDKAQKDGDDILFMDGSGVSNRLFYEIESYDGLLGRLVAWVNIPNLVYNQDTIIYLYYGNSGSYCQETPELIWDSDYLMVQHMNGFSANDLDDSTSNNNDVSAFGGDPSYQQTGKIGYCVEFDGNDHLSIPKGPWDFVGEVTISWWIDIGDSQDGYEGSMTTSESGACYQGWWIEQGTVRNAHMFESRVVVVSSAELKSLSTNTFYYMTITKDRSDNTKWYKNGVDVTGSFNSHSGTIGDDNHDLGIGILHWKNYNEALSGKLDEIHISTVARSETWISTEYQNQNDPLSFFSVGPEESGP